MQSRYKRLARQYNLEIIEPDALTVSRRKWGRGFRYFDKDGQAIIDDKSKTRFQNLAIPPSYEDVYFAPHASMHLQASGKDGSGKLQYFYHDKWEHVRNRIKSLRLLKLIRALPRIKRHIDSNLELEAGSNLTSYLSFTVLFSDKTLQIGTRSL
jgi:DNA topoisomerase-1